MYFGSLPPEINSGRMYTGPGSGPMLAAAAAWDGLAAELQVTGAAYSSVISSLTIEAWQGPSSAAMAAAAAPYVMWLRATAAQAAQAATLATAAVDAFETALAATVPPSVIAANRSLLASLVAANIFGQNTAAIAATEAQYAEMWAQDAAAMYNYASQSAAATAVTPFALPPQTTNPSGLIGELLTALEMFVNSVVNSAHTQFSELFAAVPTALQSFTTIVTGPDPLGALVSSLQTFAGLQTLNSISGHISLVPKLTLPANDTMISTIMGLALATKALASAPAAEGAGVAKTLAVEPSSSMPALGSAASSGAPVSASRAGAGLVGGLSVPPSWATATPAIRTVAALLSSAGEGAVPAAAVGQASLLGGLALAGMAGSALGAAAPSALPGAFPGAGSRVRATSLKDSQSPEKLQRLVAEMAEKPESVQHWHTDSAKLDELLAELSRKPGIHAVHLSKDDPTKSKPPTSLLG